MASRRGKRARSPARFGRFGAWSLLAVVLLLYALENREVPEAPRTGTESTGADRRAEGALEADGAVERAFAARRSDVQVTVEGRVDRVLRDDLEGSRHQRFLMVLPSGHRILVSHNIDLAPRLEGLREGETLEVRGEYEWNDRGGVVHWTHHDPAGRHPGGWIARGTRRYE